jgi:hypothetical protein
MAMVSDAANGAAPAELRAVCSQARQSACEIVFGFAPPVRGGRRATARGEGCEGWDGFAPSRPLEAPSLVVHSARAARQTPCRTPSARLPIGRTHHRCS